MGDVSNVRWFLVLLGATAACAPAVTLRRTPGEPGHPARVVAVEPFLLQFDPDSAQPVPLGDRLAERVAEQQAYAVFGPTDLGLTDAGLLQLPLSSDGGVAGRVPEVPVSEVVILRGWAEWHLGDTEKPAPSQSGAAPAPARGRGGGRGGAGPAPDRPGGDSLYSIHLQLLDSAGHVLAGADMSSSPSSDFGPEIDRLAEKLVVVMAEAAPGQRVPRQHWWSEASLTVAGPRVVTPTPAASAAGLRSDDVVLSVGGESPTDLVIERRLRGAATGSEIPVVVRRLGAELTLRLPASS